MPNTFTDIIEIIEYINMKLNEYYEDYLIDNNYETTEDVIDKFLFEYTNDNHSIYYYDFTTLTPNCIFECLSYIHEEDMNMTGEEPAFIKSKEQLEGHMIFFVGNEWRRNN